MFPGQTTKLSEDAAMALAATIYPKKDLVVVSDTTTTTVMTTISPTFMGTFSGIMVVVNRSGANITTVTTGNILRAATIPVDMAILFVYSRSLAKWVPGAIS